MIARPCCASCKMLLPPIDLPATPTHAAVRGYVPRCPWCDVTLCVDCRCPRPREPESVQNRETARRNRLYLAAVDAGKAARP